LNGVTVNSKAEMSSHVKDEPKNESQFFSNGCHCRHILA